MTAAFMLYATAVGAMLALGAVLLEHVAARRRVGRRWAWVIALVALLALASTASWRDHSAWANLPRPNTGTAATRGADPARWSWSVVDARVSRWTGALATATARLDRPAQVLWIVVSFLLLASAAGGHWRLARRRRVWRDTVVDGVDVLIADDAVPAVLGLLRPRIVVPSWALDADAPQRDPWLVHAAAAAVILMPWNPAVWWIAARLRLAIELDCDARVLGPFADRARGDGAAVAAYGELLIAVAARLTTRAPALTVTLLERRSSLERRITVMSTPAPRSTRLHVLLAGVTVVATCAIVVALPTPTLLANAPAVTNPVPLTEVRPQYTTEAMQRKIQGTVVLTEIVDAQGLVKDVQVTKSLDREFGLDDAAIAAARAWTFRPGQRDGHAVPVQVTMEFAFTLRK